MDDSNICVGDRVAFKGRSGTSYRGTVRYIGKLSGKEGEFIGCELRAPHGTNNGRGYFECRDRHGIFIRPSSVTSIISKGQDNGRGGRGAGGGRSALSDYNNLDNGLHQPGRGSREKMPGKYSAARSHELNDQYMEDFERGFEELRLAAGGSKSSGAGSKPVSRTFGSKTGGGRNLGFGWSGVENEGRMARGWAHGPSDPSGRLFNASDRNILCMSLLGSSCVVGSADHGLKEFNIETCKMTRNLYTKKYGHSEWVTCVTHIPDGRVLSGGMDNKLCLWSSSGTRCNDLIGHSSSVSCVVASSNCKYALSGGYDKTIRVWNLKGAGSEAACLMGHKAPVMCMDWASYGVDGGNTGLLLSGSRDGVAVVWDIGAGSDARLLKGHRGHITAVSWVNGEAMCLTGAQDGRVQIWDARTSESVARIPAHIGGAVNDIVCSSDNGVNGGPLIATSGADKKIQLLDPRSGFRPLATIEHHKDFIYSMKSIGANLLTGGGDGILLVHEFSTGKLLYGLGANQGAVRCIAGTEDKLVAAGDDGNALVYDFL